MDERRCNLHPIEVRLLSIDLIHFPDQQVWIGVKVGYNLRHGQATAPLKEAKAELTGIPVPSENLQPSSSSTSLGKEASFDSCQEAGEPGGSTPLGQKVSVFWTESSP